MIDGIGGMNQAMGQIDPAVMRQKGFEKMDSNGDGSIDETELQAFADKFSQKTGTELDVKETLATYDADGNGVLNQEETDKMMSSFREAMGPPPGGMRGGPPPMSEGISAYEETETTSSLLDLLTAQAEEAEEYSPISLFG